MIKRVLTRGGLGLRASGKQRIFKVSSNSRNNKENMT